MPETIRSELSALPTHERIVIEDLLRALLECEYRGHEATEPQLVGLSDVARELAGPALATAQGKGLVTAPSGGTWGFTELGRSEAVRVMRAHRLTETKLSRQTGLAADQWHGVAHRHEHDLSHHDVDALAEALGHPRFDPHGDPIPSRDGRFPSNEEDRPLLAWPRGETGAISHIEDEPAEVFAQLAKLGLAAGMRFNAEPGAAGIRLFAEGRSVDLPTHLVPLVRVRPLGAEERGLIPGAIRLSDLADAGVATVVTLLPGCSGTERSRLLDLGFVPGSRIEHVLNSPLHGPVAYRLRGTLIALRRPQSEHVLVTPITRVTPEPSKEDNHE